MVDTNGHQPADDAVAITNAYRQGSMSKVALARAVVAYRRTEGISQAEVARRMNVTAGVEHHLESLLSLAPELITAFEADKLTFKEARALADIAPHARQIEMAEPFLSGWMPSVYVEAVVRWARARPKASCVTVVDLVMANAKVKPMKWIPRVDPVREATPTADEMQRMMLDLAARLTPLATQPYPEIATLRLRQTARILVGRLQAARLT